MQGIVRTRGLLFILSLVTVPVATIVVVLFARGYRPDFGTKSLTPTGLLVAKSYPDGAQILIDTELKSATDTTLNLPPQTYSVEIKKDGFVPWKKTLTVQAEIVTRATAWLFPSVPSLRAITSSGALRPLVSPDGGKVAYLQTDFRQSKLFTVDLSESPLGAINRDSKLVTSLPITPDHITWSPDSRQILAIASSSAQLVDLNTSQTRDVLDRLNIIQAGWDQILEEKFTEKFTSLPPRLQDLLATSAANLVWSPNEKKLLYTATASASLADTIIPPLPGSSTQTQNRFLSPNHVFVYDIEEDRNFEVGDGWTWFPSSSHLYRVEDSKVIIMEYDGQNQTTVYAGPMSDPFAAAYPSSKQLLILANLNPTLSTLPNLYAVSLR